MPYRSNSIYVHATNGAYINPSLPEHGDNCLVNRGFCILTDSSSIAGDRYLKGMDLKIDYSSNGSINQAKYTLQFAIVPYGQGFSEDALQSDYFAFVTYPITQDTIYVTTVYHAYKNGIKIDNINKPIPRGYYLVCYIWEDYGREQTSLTNFSARWLRICGRLNVSF